MALTAGIHFFFRIVSTELICYSLNSLSVQCMVLINPFVLCWTRGCGKECGIRRHLRWCWILVWSFEYRTSTPTNIISILHVHLVIRSITTCGMSMVSISSLLQFQDFSGHRSLLNEYIAWLQSFFSLGNDIIHHYRLLWNIKEFWALGEM